MESQLCLRRRSPRRREPERLGCPVCQSWSAMGAVQGSKRGSLIHPCFQTWRKPLIRPSKLAKVIDDTSRCQRLCATRIRGSTTSARLVLSLLTLLRICIVIGDKRGTAAGSEPTTSSFEDWFLLRIGKSCFYDVKQTYPGCGPWWQVFEGLMTSVTQAMVEHAGLQPGAPGRGRDLRLRRARSDRGSPRGPQGAGRGQRRLPTCW